MTSPATVGATPGCADFKSPRPRNPPEWVLATAAVLHQYPDMQIEMEVRDHERPLIEKLRQIFLQEQEYFYERFRKRLVGLVTKHPDFRYVDHPANYQAELKLDDEAFDILVWGLVRQAAQGTRNWIVKKTLEAYGIRLEPGDPRAAGGG